MFGMGFGEILLIAIIAIIALGPEKLPKAMVDMARFFRAFKKTIDDAKQSLDREINLSEIKEEALSYKNSIQQEVNNIAKIDLDSLESIELEPKKPPIPQTGDNTIQHSPVINLTAQEQNITFKPKHTDKDNSGV